MSDSPAKTKLHKSTIAKIRQAMYREHGACELVAY